MIDPKRNPDMDKSLMIYSSAKFISHALQSPCIRAHSRSSIWSDRKRSGSIKRVWSCIVHALPLASTLFQFTYAWTPCIEKFYSVYTSEVQVTQSTSMCCPFNSGKGRARCLVNRGLRFDPQQISTSTVIDQNFLDTICKRFKSNNNATLHAIVDV